MENEITSNTIPPNKSEGNIINKKTILQTIINKALACSKTSANRTGAFIESILTQDYAQLRSLSAQGLPDDLSILRSLIWKINLGYLPINSEEWDKTLDSQRKTYNYYKNTFIKKLKEEMEEYKSILTKSQNEIETFEAQSNKGLLEEIAKDVNRTHMQFSFFFQPTQKETQFSFDQIQTMIEDRRNCTFKNVENTYKIDITETHADVIARILYIFAKFSPDIAYVQGMNEIVAPIYYCYSFDKAYKEESVVNVEADCFWSFYYLMQQLKCVFNREDDNSDDGVMGKGKRLLKMLKLIDNQMVRHFDKHKIELSYFSFRWMILFFSQDFNMMDILRLWDLIFSEEDKFSYVYYVGLAIIEIKRDIILVKGLSDIISELQNIGNLDIEQVISYALKIKEKYGAKIEVIMNSSIDD